MNVMITKNKKLIEVDVSVDPINPKRGREENVDTKVVKKYLDDQNIEYGRCIKSSVITNTSDKLLGKWIFEDPNYVEVAPKRKRRRNNNEEVVEKNDEINESTDFLEESDLDIQNKSI